jgi:hypothetical protein
MNGVPVVAARGLPSMLRGRGWKVSLEVKEMNVLVAAAIGPVLLPS